MRRFLSAALSSLVRRRRMLARTLLGIVLFPVLYVVAGFGLGAIPVKPPAVAGTVPVWVVSNGMHTALVLPATGPDHDLLAFFGPPDEGPAPSWVMVGWGDREFFAHVPEWKDLTLPLAAKSAFAVHGTALSVVWLHESPDFLTDRRRLSVTPQQVRTLASWIQRSAATDSAGRPALLTLPRETPGEQFYAAKGRYHLFRTCNNWTSQGLAEAGLPHGLWTPFAPSVMGHFPPP